MVWMKFKVSIIITCKVVYRNKALASIWNMENLVEMKNTILGMQFAMTNTIYLHTCPVCRVDLTTTGVYLSRTVSFSSSPVM